MNLKQIYKNVTLLLAITLVLVSCNGHKQDSSVSTTPSFDPNENLATSPLLFDDFKNGIDIDVWEIAHTKWGKGNNGVVYQNVNYTEDGILILQSNGDNYAGDIIGYNANSGKRTGSALISNETFGPGRFEVRMKAMPRFGATSAFWTFYYDDTLKINHEIDIELNVNNDFRSIWTTNWTTINDSDHYETTTDVLNNDGEFHVYKFEWHTNPKRIDYYVDDILIHTSFTNIPTYAGRLWIGNWFPEAWAGVPDFETDYMLVDWIRYTPYKNNPYTTTVGGRSKFPQYYPKEPISLPISNLISNGGFEKEESSYRKDVTSNVKIVPNSGINSSNALYVPNNDLAYQFITGLDETFTLVLKANAKIPASSAGGYILVEYRPLETKLLGSTILNFSPSDEGYQVDQFYEKTVTLTLPKGTKRIELSFIGHELGGIYFDDISLRIK